MRAPISHYGERPQVETEVTLYTPDRSLPQRFNDQLGGEQGDPKTEMMVVHMYPLDVGLYYMIHGRTLRIESESSYKEFRERCPGAPALLRPAWFKFYFAIPDDEE